MSQPTPPTPPLLHDVLRAVPRRYRLPAFADASASTRHAGPATTLAMVIEHARAAVSRGEEPDPALKRQFLAALARMIEEAMRAESPDPAFQAAVLRHRAAQVREYASLHAHAAADRRRLHASVNAVAHPNKPRESTPAPLREAMAHLHATASASCWPALHDSARHLLAMPEIASVPAVRQAVQGLVDAPALARLRRLDALSSDPLVRQYLTLWQQHGPRAGTATAAAQGVASRHRGNAAEESAAQALRSLALRLDQAEGATASYRVVTSMRVPSSLPASHERAKTEWDVVLLRRAGTIEGAPAWDVCLLVEVKASVDAATGDLPRLLRGLRLLSHAETHAHYPFQTAQGPVCLRGASLRALGADEARLAGTVLYCCDSADEAAPRLLGAAGRMQLMSGPTALDYARALAEQQPVDPNDLEPIWRDLLASPRWTAVLHQYQTLRRVRELMVHTDDLFAAIAAVR